jgi:ubiquinone/menaquinone biosynthesis C-methylase UbiE
MTGATDETLATGFRQVDSTGASQAFIDCLDLQTGLEQTHAWKLRGFDHMRIQGGHHVLDVGCGTGDDARALSARVGPSGRVVGIDNSAEMVREAKARSEGTDLPVEFHRMAVTELDFPDESFDSIHTERVLVHVHDGASAVAEMARLLRPGGRLVMTEPDMDTNIVNAGDRDVTRRILSHRGDLMANGWIGRELPGFCHAAGLRSIEIHPEVQVITDPRIGRGLFDLEAAVDAARQAGLITSDEGAAWLAVIEAHAKSGSYFGSCTLFTVVATRT